MTCPYCKENNIPFSPKERKCPYCNKTIYCIRDPELGSWEYYTDKQAEKLKKIIKDYEKHNYKGYYK